MTDIREPLELAARACGYMPNNNWQWSERAGTDGAFRYRAGGEWIEWAPHTDDGDSARMRSVLGVNVLWSDTAVHCLNSFGEAFESFADHNNNRDAALRLCALRVAAEIGRGVK